MNRLFMRTLLLTRLGTNKMMNTSTVLTKFAQGFSPLFYLVPPSASSFKRLDDVPDYLDKVVPYFFVLIGLELVIRWLKGMSLPRVNDSFSSITAGISLSFGRVVVGAFEISSYAWVHHNLCLFPLPWDSAITWWVTFIGVDFGYYWFHRMAHEVNLFWAAHQVHHSSQDYTLSTALRQSVLQRFTSWFFYLPMALLVPPSAYLTHKQFNLLYQFWIHTEVVSTLGPLEWILNTPSHHRVHHGTNPYCIDKNYAGVLIIWDRIFGTFEPEADKVYYGLMHQPETWNPISVQFSSLISILKRIHLQKGITDKLKLLFYSPAWVPGYGRMGQVYTKPFPPISAHLKLRFGKPTSWWLNVYCVVHFSIVIHQSLQLDALTKLGGLPYIGSLGAMTYLILSLTNFGLMFDLRPVSATIEVFRLTVLLLVDFMLVQQGHVPDLAGNATRWISVFSLVLWTSILFNQQLKK